MYFPFSVNVDYWEWTHRLNFHLQTIINSLSSYKEITGPNIKKMKLSNHPGIYARNYLKMATVAKCMHFFLLLCTYDWFPMSLRHRQAAENDSIKYLFFLCW